MRAQTGATAQLGGTITDPLGVPVSGCQLEVRNLDTGLARTVLSSAEGRFVFLDLAPGSWEVSAANRNEFAPLRARVDLTVNQQAVLHLRFQLESRKDSLNVQDDPWVLEPTRTELSQMIAQKQISELPVNGRQFLDFVLLTPNVTPGRTNISNPSSPGEPGQVDLSFAGLHESVSMILVDGANNMNRVFGRSRSAPPEEAVREFRVLNNSYPVNFGPASGGVVSIVTKSGTNELHGAFYEYFRNGAMDARNVLTAGGFDQLRQNQFGTSLGGKIVADRLLYFMNYEGQRRGESPPYSSVLLVNIDAINAQKQRLGLAPEVLAGKQRTLDFDSAIGRLDAVVSPSTQAAFSYRFRSDRATNLPAATGQLSAPSNFRDSTIGDHAAILSLTTTLTPQVLNQGHVQVAHRAFDFAPVSYQPQLSISNTLDMGRHFNAINGDHETRVELSDGVSMVRRGGHTVSIGGAFSYDRIAFFYDPFDPAYAVFPNLSSFLAPTPFAVVFGFSQAADGTRPAAPAAFAGPANIPVFNSNLHPETNAFSYSVYAQDQWRPRPGLTVNYGLRWDLDRMPAQYFAPYYRNFGPRVGIAQSAFHDRMTFRVSAGRYQGQAYSVPYLIAVVAGQDAAFGLVRGSEDYSVSSSPLHNPFYSNPALATANLLAFLKSGVYPALNPANYSPAQQFISTIKRYNHGGPFTYQWSAQADYQVSRASTLSVNYFGLKGLFLPSAINGNVAPAALTQTNGKADYAIALGSTVARTLNPLVSPLSFFYDATAQSTYHSLNVSFSRRFQRYYTATANYSWSHTIDSGGDPSLNGTPQDPYRRYLEKANSKQDVPQRLVGSMTGQTPERGSWWYRRWKVAGIFTAQSAGYYSMFAGSDANHDGNANTDRVGLAGRNTYRGDPLVNLDVRATRILHAGDKLRAEFTAEAFNAFNTLNVTDLNTVYGAPNFVGAVPAHYGDGVGGALASFGSIRATSPPRQLQLSLRLRF